MARKSSKNREKTYLRKCRSQLTPDLEQQYENLLKNAEGVLSSKVARRIQLIETVLTERTDCRIEILKVVENDTGAVMSNKLEND